MIKINISTTIVELHIPDYEEAAITAENLKDGLLPHHYFFEGVNWILEYIKKHNSAEKILTP